MADWTDFSFEMVRGDDHVEEFVIERGDPPAAVDVSGYQEFTMNLCRFPGDTPLTTLTKTAGGIAYSTTGQDGLLKVKIPHSATTGLPNRRQTLFADLVARDAFGETGTPMRGTCTVGAKATAS